MNKRILILLGLLTLAGCSKYESGDCITPTDPFSSWYGQYARVEAFGKVPDYEGKAYTLEFPNYNSASKHFTKDIEFDTKAVGLENCLLVNSSN